MRNRYPFSKAPMTIISMSQGLMRMPSKTFHFSSASLGQASPNLDWMQHGTCDETTDGGLVFAVKARTSPD